MPITTVKKRKYKVGYTIYYQEVTGEEAGHGPSFTMRSAYTPDGAYIGNVKMARQLIVKVGIKPEMISSDSSVCQVGFQEATQKWYGWSHRCLAGFAIDDKLFDADWPEATDETPFIAHGSKTITTLEEARESAAAFAHYVS